MTFVRFNILSPDGKLLESGIARADGVVSKQRLKENTDTGMAPDAALAKMLVDKMAMWFAVFDDEKDMIDSDKIHADTQVAEAEASRKLAEVMLPPMEVLQRDNQREAILNGPRRGKNNPQKSLFDL